MFNHFNKSVVSVGWREGAAREKTYSCLFSCDSSMLLASSYFISRLEVAY